MMEVSRISVSKDGLRAMPKAERTLLLLMGHASNQITALARVLDFYRRNTPSSDAERDINSAQYHMFARFLIGVLFEGWLLIERRLLKGKLGKEYIPQLEDPPREALNALKRQFGGSILAKLRNDVAFHHPHDAALEAGFQAGIASPDFDSLSDWYIAKPTWCAYSVLSDVVIGNCMLTNAGGNARQRDIRPRSARSAESI
jgi:hypothetical protein